MTEIKIPDDGGQETITTVDIGIAGYRLPIFMSASNTKAVFDTVPDFECRPDDVMLASYPKCGTNWLYEILMMMRTKSAKRVASNKGDTMLERIPGDQVDTVPSPRVLNCHYLPKYLPKSMKTKGIKTVLCNRNPKDATVSYYNHVRGMKMYGYENGKWQNWIQPFIQGKNNAYGKYAHYLNEWQQVIEDGPEYPIHVVYYEDLKKDGIHEINRLAKFLEIELDDQLKADIIDMCGFDKMSKEKFPPKTEKILNNGFNFFRKGKVGDWKNWFTVSQDKLFEATWNKDIRKDTIFKFKYV